MKKLLIALFIASTSIFFVACNKSVTTNPGNNNSTSSKITAEQAKYIALKHANLTIDKVKFDNIEYDTDNGLDKYDIDFHYNNQEYSYEIDTKTGEILSHGVDKE